MTEDAQELPSSEPPLPIAWQPSDAVPLWAYIVEALDSLKLEVLNRPGSVHATTGDDLFSRLRAIEQYAVVHLYRIVQLKGTVESRHLYAPVLFEISALSDVLQNLNRLFAISAVADGAMTRREVANALKVHENTVARWVKNADAEQRKCIVEIVRVAIRQQRNVSASGEPASHDDLVRVVRDYDRIVGRTAD